MIAVREVEARCMSLHRTPVKLVGSAAIRRISDEAVTSSVSDNSMEVKRRFHNIASPFLCQNANDTPLMYAASHMTNVARRSGLDIAFDEHSLDLLAMPMDSPIASIAAASGKLHFGVYHFLALT